MACVEQALHRLEAVPLFAFHDVPAREHEVIDDSVGHRPLPEQVVPLEERIVAVRRVRDDQRLRRHRVLFHQVRNAWIGVDHDLIGQALHAPLVRLLVADELLAVRPVRVTDRQPVRRIGVEHLLRGDDLDLVGVRVEAELAGNLRDRGVVPLEQVEVPVGAARDGAHCASLRKSSRNTG
jgi:hypothetical protein